jgi:hypothetical protein
VIGKARENIVVVVVVVVVVVIRSCLGLDNAVSNATS